MWKVTNKTDDERQFISAGKVIVVPARKSVISTTAPNDNYVWKVEKTDEKPKTLEMTEVKDTSKRDFLIGLDAMEEELADALLDKFGSIEKIKEANEEELSEISGIGKKRAKRIFEQLHR